MRQRFVFSAIMAITVSVSGLLLSAQAPGSVSQIGSTLGGSGRAGGASGDKTGSGGGGLISVPEDFSKLRIAPGFLLDAEVFSEPDLSGPYRVDDEGNLTLPFVGAVNVSGDTLAQAQKKIGEAYEAGKILKNPQVTLNVLQYAPTLVTVLGEVNTPGRLQMLAPHSLLEVISMAGGETQLAGGEVQVRHEQDGKVTTASYSYGRNGDGNAISGVVIHNGDTVVVPRAGIVYVLGAVNRPGGFLMQEDGKLDVVQALSLAYGLQMTAKTAVVHVIRRKPDGSFELFSVSYQKMVNGKAAPPQLQAQDIVYVPQSPMKNLAEHIAGIYTAAAQAGFYAVR